MLFWGNDRRTALLEVRFAPNPDGIAGSLAISVRPGNHVVRAWKVPQRRSPLSTYFHVCTCARQSGASLEAESGEGGLVSVPEANLQLHGNLNFRPCCRAWDAEDSVIGSIVPPLGVC